MTDENVTVHKKKTMRGIVLRRSGDKSIVVRVERTVIHPRFKKYVRKHRNMHVHDAENVCSVGDDVFIRESRPYSATKRWIFVENANAASETAA